MPVTDSQVRKFMDEMCKHGEIGKASMKAGFDRATGRKYLRIGKIPSELAQKVRTWKTRKNPFEEDWPEVEEMLDGAPELEAKALFEWLVNKKKGKYQEGQVRTFQRHVKCWRAMRGPDKEVFFPQQHRPGEAMQTDFTHATELGVTICGIAFEHMICHTVLPYSNWEWATVCLSESFAALKRGVQGALFRLGHLPEFLQTDNSSSATHNIGSGKRLFNKDYEDFVSHFGIKPRTIAIRKSNQNGDVESLNGVLKRRLKQHLILRGSCDFASIEEYEKWLQEALCKANELRRKRISEEMPKMRPLQVRRLPEYTVIKTNVSIRSTIRIKNNTYSVPSRLIGEEVKVRVYDDRIEVFYGQKLQLTTNRILGKNGHRIDYRHVISSLVNKPGAFARYKYRDALFPTLTFRKAYDFLCSEFGHGRRADLQYLKALKIAAFISETDVETALTILMEEGIAPDSDNVKNLVAPAEPEVPFLTPYKADLADYDALFEADLGGL